MLVYDITNARSFDNIATWLERIYKHAPEVSIYVPVDNVRKIQGIIQLKKICIPTFFNKYCWKAQSNNKFSWLFFACSRDGPDLFFTKGPDIW